MRLIHEILHLRAEQVVPARSAVVVAHPLLHDSPFTVIRHEEAVMIDAEPVLHSGSIHLRGHAAVVREPLPIEARACAELRQLQWRATRRLSLPASDED